MIVGFPHPKTGSKTGHGLWPWFPYRNPYTDRPKGLLALGAFHLHRQRLCCGDGRAVPARSGPAKRVRKTGPESVHLNSLEAKKSTNSHTQTPRVNKWRRRRSQLLPTVEATTKRFLDYNHLAGGSSQVPCQWQAKSGEATCLFSAGHVRRKGQSISPNGRIGLGGIYISRNHPRRHMC